MFHKNDIFMLIASLLLDYQETYLHLEKYRRRRPSVFSPRPIELKYY